MKKIIFIALITLLTFTKLNAQFSNLVANGDFEIYTSLPIGGQQSNRAAGWNNVNGQYTNFCGSPDYYYVGSYMGGYGAITPFSGNGQMGLGTYLNAYEYREYISTQLNTSMIVGNTYKVSFYLTNGNGTGFFNTSNNFGLHFSMNPLIQSCYEVIQVIPQLEITSIISSWNNWTQFVFNYTPTNSFNYITIGNFRSDANTSLSISGGIAYYFIDKIEIYPLLKLKGDSIICKGASSTIKVIAGESIVKWADSLNPNTIFATDSTITVTPLTTTTYFAYSSIDTAKFTVHVINQPLVNLGNDTTLCQGQTILLNATKPNCTYLWQDSTTNPTYNVSLQGTYWVKVTNHYYCFSYDTINVTYNPLPLVNLGNDTILCPEQYLLLNATLLNSTYLWQDNSQNPTYNVIQQSMYWVQVTTNNCNNSDTINVYYSPLLNLNLGIDTTLCYGNIIKLDATNANSTYKWQDNSSSSTYIINQQGTYWVTVTDNNNCSVSDTINITYQSCETPGIYIPNAFTPNGDGKNEEFKIETIKEFSEFHLYIYNRWGNLLFESEDITKGWDGTYKGKTVHDGLYVYLLKATIKDTNEQIRKSGRVTVVR